MSKSVKDIHRKRCLWKVIMESKGMKFSTNQINSSKAIVVLLVFVIKASLMKQTLHETNHVFISDVSLVRIDQLLQRFK